MGTDRGIAILGRKQEWYQITGANSGLPYEDAYHIALHPEGQLWIGTSIGAALWHNDKWECYSSKRWLPDDRVTTIGLQQDGTAWIGTSDGLSRIEKRPYTLEEKTTYFEDRIQARHNRYGFVTSCFLERPGDLSSYVHKASDNDGLRTALYIAAESFRYAVTGDEAAKAFAQKSLQALMMLEEKTTIDGFPARAIIKKGEKVIQSRGEWHDTADGLWQWKGDTSAAEINGHMFGYAVYYDLVADAAEKRQIAQVVGRIMTHIVDNDFRLIDVDGKHTEWGVWGPHILNGKRKAQQGLNSPGMLSHLKTAYHITQDKKFQRAYLNLIRVHRDVQDGIDQKPITSDIGNDSNDQLVFISYYPLLNYEAHPERRKIHLLCLERSWHYARAEKCPLWNFIYGVLTGNPCDLEASMEALQSIPMDFICWNVRNSHRADIEIDSHAGRHGEVQSVEVLPPDERTVMKWNGNPFQLDSNHGEIEEDEGTFFLLPYWLGRYHDLI